MAVGEVVASIRDARGGNTVLDWLRTVECADTGAVASRFCMDPRDARKTLKRLERDGLVTSKMETFGGWHGGSGGRTLRWQAV